MKKGFKRHFRIYLVNNHPAYIVDENGDYYVFHRSSHKSKISNKATFEIKMNPIVGDLRPMYIAKRKQIERKGRFSKNKLPIKNGININYEFIDTELLNKKTPSKQIYKNRSTTSGSKIIKPKKKWFVNRFSS